MRRVLCYGDSNTWGYVPETGQRYQLDVRWTGVAAKILGDSYCILEDGINGRRTVWDDPYEGYRNGLESLGYSLLSCKPVDLVVLMLGTNDLNHTDANGAAKGVATLIQKILNANTIYPDKSDIFPGKPELMLVAPIMLHKQISVLRPDIGVAEKYEESYKFSEKYKAVADTMGVHFLNAANFAEPSEIDCLHMDEVNHYYLGIAIANKIQSIFETKNSQILGNLI